MQIFELEILKPDRSVFKGQVKSITVPGSMGGFQVLYNHAPLMSSIEIGTVRVIDENDKEMIFAISGGVIEVENNKTLILANAIERTDEIDVERAKAAEERARRRLSEKGSDLDLDRAELALKRAINRMSTSKKYF